MQVIETIELRKRYPKQVAVDGITFTVGPGQVFGFLGPNGSGKTTTIGMLLGIITPTAGEIRLFGLSGYRGLHQARQRIGATLETPNFYPYLSGLDNLRIVANVKRVGRREIDAALDQVGLTVRATSKYQTYSLGMKQRLAIAATMLGDPALIILDEPANGLDPEGMREIREIIGALAAQGKTIFLSSHLLWEVERTCTHVAILRKGQIVRQGTVREMTAGNALAAVRGGDPAVLCALAAEYPGAVSARVVGEDVVVELRSDDLAALNEFVAGRGVYLSYIMPRQQSLEEVFMEMTRTDHPVAAGGVA
jgi:ABC-2 type transport system ATP-binding protein